jgi:hypothetical protein
MITPDMPYVTPERQVQRFPCLAWKRCREPITLGQSCWVPTWDPEDLRLSHEALVIASDPVEAVARFQTRFPDLDPGLLVRVQAQETQQYVDNGYVHCIQGILTYERHPLWVGDLDRYNAPRLMADYVARHGSFLIRVGSIHYYSLNWLRDTLREHSILLRPDDSGAGFAIAYYDEKRSQAVKTRQIRNTEAQKRWHSHATACCSLFHRWVNLAISIRSECTQVIPAAARPTLANVRTLVAPPHAPQGRGRVDPNKPSYGVAPIHLQQLHAWASLHTRLVGQPRYRRLPDWDGARTIFRKLPDPVRTNPLWWASTRDEAAVAWWLAEMKARRPSRRPAHVEAVAAIVA